jgi:hypothetical protein
VIPKLASTRLPCAAWLAAFFLARSQVVHNFKSLRLGDFFLPQGHGLPVQAEVIAG